MRKYLTIFIIGLFIISFWNLTFLNSESINNPDITPIYLIDNNVIDQVKKTSILQNLNKLDGFFTENKGQIRNDSVRYYIQGKGVWFLDDGVVFEVRDESSIISQQSTVKGQGLGVESQESELFLDPLARFEPPELPKYKKTVIKLNFEGSNQIIPKGQGLLPHRSNFFYGNDSAKWFVNVPNYQDIIYENIYDNIDLRYYSTPKGLKYDFIVHPNGKINDIHLKYNNAQKLQLDNFGNINIQTLFGNLMDSNLFIYQDIENNKKVIEGKFKELNSITYGFEIDDEYNRNRDLIIDPLVYSTFVGGNDIDRGSGITLDSNGVSYVTGLTRSSNFPITNGVYDNTYDEEHDVFVFKLSSDGSSLIYSTFISGNNRDFGSNIEIDSNGNAIVAGSTKSTDFPCTNGVYDSTPNGGEDIFALKLNSMGNSIIHSTFIGGNSNERVDDFIVDSKMNIYITGITNSLDFPTTNGVFDRTFNGGEIGDAYALKISSDYTSLVYSTFLGGNSWDYGLGIALDSNNNVVITGQTNSTNFPSTNNSYDPTYNDNFDIFVTKFNHNCSNLLFSTFIGTSGGDWGRCIALDSQENIYIAGATESPDFPVTSGAYDDTINSYEDIVIFKLDPLGSALIYSTFIGGRHQQEPSDIAINLNDNVFITGCTYSSDFPNTTGAFDNIYNGGFDVFLLMMNPTCSSLLYSTYIGGGAHDEGIGMAINSNRNVYLTGSTWSANFPNTTGAFDPTFNGGREDAFVLKLDMNLPYNFPSILDFETSEQVITRTNSIYLYSNVTDVEDLEDALTIQFEYKELNEHIWKSDYISNLQYNNSRWEAVFTPLKDAKLGSYDFRVRVRDSDQLFSTWYYLNDSLSVLNNIPIIEDITLSNNRVLSGGELTIWVNGSDVEEPEENLTLKLEYLDANERWWNSVEPTASRYFNEKWKYELSIPIDYPFGYFNVRARFNDSDGNYSQWLYLNDSLLVYNRQPIVLDIELSNHSVFRTNSILLFVNGTDYETPESMLKFYGQYKPRSEDNWSELTGNYSSTDHRWEGKFNTNINSRLGFYNFRVKFENNKSISNDWVYLNNSLEVLNNPPSISEGLDKIMVGFERRFINLSEYGSDIEDFNENLTWEIDQNSINSTLFSVDKTDISSNILHIAPETGASGTDDITLKLTDKDGDEDIKTNITIYIGNTISKYYNVNVSVLPNPVDITQGSSNRVILTIKNIGNLSDNYTVFFGSKAFDINDIQFNKDSIWLNPGGQESVNITISVPENMKVGTYKIEFYLESDFVSDNVILTVNVKVKETGTIGDEYYYMFFAGIMILIFLIIIITFFIIKRKKKKKQILLPIENISIKPNVHPITKQDQAQGAKSLITSEVTRITKPTTTTPLAAPQPKTTITPSATLVGKPPISAPTQGTGQIPEIEKKPQLPPGKNQETKPENDSTNL